MADNILRVISEYQQEEQDVDTKWGNQIMATK